MLRATSALAGLALAGLLSPVALSQETKTLADAEALLGQERLPEAEAILSALATKTPSDVQVRFRLGYVLFRQRKLAPARLEFEAVLKTAPPSLESRYFLGRIALLNARPAEAVRWLEPVVAAGDHTYDAASQLALAFVKAGKPQAAIEPLRQAIRREPWDGGLYYRLGRLHQELQQPELAREALGMAARLNAAGRENVEALMAAGASFREGRPAEAMERLRQVVDRPEAEPNILLAAGLLYTEMQQPAPALAAFERAAHMAGNEYGAQFNYGLALLRAGRVEDATPPLQRAVALLPQSFEAQLTVGLAAVMAKNYAAALDPLGKAHRLEPAHARVASLLATALLRTGQAEKAVTLLASLAAKSAEPAPALLYIEALQATGRESDALTAARQAHDRFPQDLTASMTLGQLLTRAGRYAEARPVFTAVVASGSAPPEAVLGLADTLQKSGQHGDAVEQYRKALPYPTVGLQARLGLARSLAAQQRLDEARQVLEDGQREYPDEAALYIDLARLYTRLREPQRAAEATRRVEELKARQAQ